MITVLTILLWQRTTFAEKTIIDWGPVITALIGFSIILAIATDIALVKYLWRS